MLRHSSFVSLTGQRCARLTSGQTALTPTVCTGLRRSRDAFYLTSVGKADGKTEQTVDNATGPPDEQGSFSCAQRQK